MRSRSVHLTRAWIPNSVTAFSVFLGYLSIIAAFEGEAVTAAWLIVMAGVCDLFDGRLARMVGGTSKFGSYFDSLADAINYGVAPSLLFYELYFHRWGVAGALLSFLPTVFGALRLARFNVISDEEESGGYFVGLPTTMAAGLLASYVIFMHDVFGGYGTPMTAGILLALAAVLMVSAVPYEHNRFLTDRALHRNWKALLLLLALVTAAWFGGRALFPWLALYLAYGLVRSAFNTARYELEMRKSR